VVERSQISTPTTGKALMQKQKAICFVGRTGSGKGTVSSLLSERLGWPIISTGNLIRQEAKRNTLLGEQCREILDKGQRLSAQDIIVLDADAIILHSVEPGLIFEGSPRWGEEAEFLSNHLDAVFLLLDVPEEICRGRLLEVRKRPYDTEENISIRFSDFENIFAEVTSVEEVSLIVIDGTMEAPVVANHIEMVLSNWLRT
jgi:adenylate kinase family enzyme